MGRASSRWILKPRNQGRGRDAPSRESYMGKEREASVSVAPPGRDRCRGEALRGWGQRMKILECHTIHVL